MKTADELECIASAQAINEEAMLAGRAAGRARRRGDRAVGHVPAPRSSSSGATANTVDPIWQVMPAARRRRPVLHDGDVVFPTPTTDRPFAAGDVIWVDTGIDYEGYASDFGCTFVVGGPEARHRDQ